MPIAPSSRDFAWIIQAHLDTFFNDVDELMASTATATPPVTAGKSMKGSNSPSAVLRQLQHQQQPHHSSSAGGPAVFKYDSGSIVSFVAASGMSSVLFPQGSLRYNGSVGSGRAASGSAAAAAAASAAAAMGDSAQGAAEQQQQQCQANEHHVNMLTNNDVSHFAPVAGGATGDAFAALGSDWEVVHRQHQLMRLGSSGIQTTSTTTGAASTSFQHTTSMFGSSGSTMAGLRSPVGIGVGADGVIATTFQQIPSMAQLIGGGAPPRSLMHRLPEETAVDSSVPLHQVLTSAVPSNQQQHLFTPTPRRSNVAGDRRPSPHTTTTITLPSQPPEEALISSPQSAASAPSPHFLMNDSHSNSNSADHHLQPPHQRSPLTKDQQSSTSGRNSSSATTASAATAASLLLLISDLRATLAPLFPTSTFAHRGSLPQSATTISSFDQRGRRTASGSSETVLNFSGRDGVVGGGVLNSSIGAGGFVVPLLHQRSSIESTAASVIFQQQQQQQPNFQELRLPFQYRQSFSSISQNGTAAAAAAAAGGSPRVSPRQAFVGVPRPPPPPSAVYFMRLTQLPSDSQDTRNNENSVPSLSPHAEILLQQQQQQQQQHYLNANLNAAAAELSVNSGSNQPQHHHDEGAAGNSAPNQTPLSQRLENEFVSGDDAVGGEPHNSRPRSPRMTSPAGGPAAELLISVAHPGVAASSLLVSFGWDSDVTHRLEDDDDEDAEEDEEDGDDDIGDDEEIDSLHNNESSKPFDGASMAAMPTAARAILEPRPPHQQSPAMANRKLHDAYNTTTTTIIPAPPPPPPSLFSLTPIISNNYVLLGGLGKYRWKWERPIDEHRRHHQHPSIDPSTEGIHNKSPGATRCITMREDVLLAFSLKEKEVVVVKMLSPLSSLASVAPAHRVQETSGGVPLPLNSPQGSEDASAGAPPNTMGSNVVATGRALRQARIASGVAELKKLASLRHPNLVTLIDVLVDATAGCFYLVQEHCDAGTISDYFTTTVSLLQRRTTRDAFDDDNDSSPLSHQEEEKGHNHHQDHNQDIRVYPAIAKCLVHVLRGLLYLHQHGIAHRSIALGTILVTYNGVARLSGAALPPECSRHSAALQKTNASAPIHCRDGSPFFESTSAELFSKDIAAVGQTFASLMPEEDEERTAAYLRRFSGTLGPDEGASRMAPLAVPVMLGKGEQLITSPTPRTTHDDIRSQLQLLALLQEMSNGGQDDGSAVGTAEVRTPEMKDPTLLVASFLKRAEELAKRF